MSQLPGQPLYPNFPLEEKLNERQEKMKEITSGSNFSPVTYGLSGVGVLTAWIYCFKSGKGFWAYIGYGIVGSMAGGIAGNILSLVFTNKKSQEPAGS